MKCKRKAITIIIMLLAIVLAFAGCTGGNTKETTTAKAEITTASNSSTKISLPKTDTSAAAIIKAKAGDIIQYGSYIQGKGTADKSSVSWEVLAVENGKALLLSKMVLDCKPYNDIRKNITWENCSLRAWLNNDFLNSVLDQSEQKAVVLSTLPNKDNAQFKTDGGNDTQDKIFCLSVDEAKMYYKTDDAKIAICTDYAESKGAYTFERTVNKNKEKDAGWWLRSPGHDADDACDVYYNGKIHYDYVDYTSYIGVRPAMWLDLKSDLFKTAATSTTAAQGSASSTAATSTTATLTTAAK